MINRRNFVAATAGVIVSAASPQKLLSQEIGRCEVNSVVLADGRQLGYAEYGDPNGWPVLYFHGIPTSRIEARFFADAALRARCRLIAIDRPGVGLSTFKPCRTIVDWMDDVNEFIESSQLPHDLDLSHFSIACFSSGAAYALLCAARMPTTRLKSVGIVDGIAPLDRITGDGGVAKFAFELALRKPNVTRTAFEVSTRLMHRRPHIALRRTSVFFSSCDRRVFFEPQNARILVDSYLETVRCGPAGVMHDMSLLAKPWGFPVESAQCPVSLFYGACDKTTPVASMGNYLHSAIGNATMEVLSCNGHLSMLNNAGDILFAKLLLDAAGHSINS